MTEKLYYMYPDKEEFEAMVIESITQGKEWKVVLDKSCFYPEGGGQPADNGRLGDIAVTDVQKEGNTVYHYTKAEVKPGPVTGKIDMERRFDYMQQHTGQHLISGALWRVAGHKTVSVHMGAEYTTIEVLSPTVSSEQLTETENMVNRIIREDLTVRAINTNDGELNNFPLRKVPDRKGDIRLVEIGEFDCVACGGLHLQRTGLVQLVKATAIETIRGNTRITWKIAQRALVDYAMKQDVMMGLKPLLAAGENGIVEKTERIIKDLELEMKQNNLLQSRLAELMAQDLAAKGKNAANSDTTIITAAWHHEDDQLLKKVMKNLLNRDNLLVCLVNIDGERFRWSIGCSEGVAFPFNNHREKLFTISGGKGGGRHPLWQGSGSKPGQLEEFFSLFSL